MHLLHLLTRRLVPVAGAFLAALSMAAAAQSAEEGKEYLRLKSPQPVESGKKIEVIEFFSYGCPHCADLEPVLQGWVKTMPADVQLRRVPVMYQERWIPLAKIYYTLDALGEEKRLSPEVFAALHSRGTSLWQDRRSRAESGARPEESRGHVQLVCDIGQGQPRPPGRGSLPDPIGPKLRRRRKIRHPQGQLAPGHSADPRRADRESPGGATEGLTVVA